MKGKISFIGAGRVGTALGYLLNNRGYKVVGIASRNLNSAESAAHFIGEDIAASNDLFVFVEESDIVFITTNDDAITHVIQGIAENCQIRDGQIFVHVSGSLPAKVFMPIELKGGLGISIHPLQTIASPIEGIKNILGSLFAIEGNERAFDTASEIVKSLDGTPFFIESEKKPLYHLAAVISCNYFVTLIDTSMKIFENIQIDNEKGLTGLLKLIRGTINNVERLGTKQALTGPIARGDVDTIKDHIKAIKKFMPQLNEFYKILGKMTVDLALEKGSISKSTAKKIVEEINQI